MTTVGLIGSGHIGSTVARLAIAAGHDAVLSNSRGPQTLVDLAVELGPRVRPATAEEAADAGDIVLVALPVRAYPEVPVAPLAGKVVMDAGNYYPGRDGQIPELDAGTLFDSEYLQLHLPGALVVRGPRGRNQVARLFSRACGCMVCPVGRRRLEHAELVAVTSRDVPRSAAGGTVGA